MSTAEIGVRPESPSPSKGGISWRLCSVTRTFFTKAIPEGVGVSCGKSLLELVANPYGESGGAETAPSLLPAGGLSPSSAPLRRWASGWGGADVLLRTALSKGAGKRRRETGAWCIWRQPFASRLLLFFFPLFKREV